MKKTLLAGLAVGVMMLGMAATSQASLIFSDNFNGENGGHAALNYTKFTNWTVSDGTVDLIGNGSQWDFIPGNGLYVDMDGSTNNAGTMTSTTLDLAAGQYILSFYLAGNHVGGTYGDSDTVTAQVNTGITTANYTLSASDPFTQYTQSFSVLDPTAVTLSFAGWGGNNVGLLLDNIELDRVGPVPEPATMLLMGTGLVGLVGARRKKKA